MALIFLATFAHAQDSQFLFDANGNLFVQTGATTATPQIIGQPQDRIVAPGEGATFSVVAADTRALSYQWRFNGTNISGATNDAVLLSNVSTNHEGQYSVVLTNASGSVTSAPALLLIDSDYDGVADSWELAYFTNLNQNSAGDVDGDGVSNFQEFLDDTNPTNKVSARYRLLVLRDGGSVIKISDQSSYTNGESVTLTASASAPEIFGAWLGDIVTRSNTVTLVMTNNKTVYARFTPIEFTWANPASGDWNLAANWTPALVPRSNDSVVIARTVTVTLDAPAECTDVTLGGEITFPTLTGSGSLTVRGTLLWISGEMSGGGTTLISPGATVTFANPSVANLNNRVLENNGTIRWIGAGNIVLTSGAVITNRSGALFEVQNSAALTSFGSRFDNAGTFRKSVNVGATTLANGLNFNNTGAIEIQSGTLLFNCGFSNSGTVNIQSAMLNLANGSTNSGSINLMAGGALILSGGTHTAGESSILTGAGHFTVSSGTANLAGLVNVTGSNTFSGTAANLTGQYFCANNIVTISGGTANFSGTGAVSPAVLNLSNGELTGTSTVTVLSAMNWTGGTMSGSGRTIIPAGATLNLSPPGVVIQSARTLENGGTILFTGGGIFGVNGNAVITNRAGALFRIENEHFLGLGGGGANGRFDNAGMFRKSAGVGTTIVVAGLSFNNFGTVEIRSGILAANGGYTSTSNALLNSAIGGTTPGTGFGQLQVAGAVTLNGALSVDLINGFLPATNDTFTVLTAGTRNVTFANFYYPSNAVTMQFSNNPTSVVVHVTDVLTAIPRPLLLPPEWLGSDIKLTWMAVPNTAYRLEFSPNLANLTNWNPIPGDVTASSYTASKLDPLTPSNRFYRVRVLP